MVCSNKEKHSLKSSGSGTAPHLQTSTKERTDSSNNPISSSSGSSPPSAALGSKLASRPDADKLVDQGVLKSNKVAGTLAPVSNKLEQRMRRASLSKILSVRPDPATAAKHAAVSSETTGVSPALQSTARRLSLQLNKDQVGQLLTSRPALAELERTGVAVDSKRGVIAPLIQQKRVSLSKQMNADQVSQLLETRPDASEICRRGNSLGTDLASTLAPALAPTAAKLEKQILAAQLSKQIKLRPNFEALAAKDIPEEDGVAPVLAANKQALKKSVHCGSVKQELSNNKMMMHLGQSKQGSPGNNSNNSKFMQKQRLRAEIAIAFKAAAHLAELQVINATQKGFLKDLILTQDKRVIAAVQVFQIDHDISEMLDTFYHILDAAMEEYTATMSA